MEEILFLTHTEIDGALGKAALEALSGAVKLAQELDGSTLTAGLVGGDVQPAANAIAGCGAVAFLGVAGEGFAVSRYVSDAAAFEAIVRTSEPSIVVAPTTSRVARALPGVAQRVGGRVDTHVTALEVEGADLRIERWYYRQRMLATLRREGRPWFIVIDGGSFETWSGASGSADLQSVTVDLPALHTRVVGEQAAAAGAATIRPDAGLLFVAGAGWTKKQPDGQMHVTEAEALILDFLGKSGASLGSSKSLVDQSGEGERVLSFMTHLNQVGQTGSTPRHPKGLATCCHGEEPHVVGWRFIKERRAVNLDPNCGWAQGKADVLYVADAFQVVAKVNEMLGGG